MFQNFDHDNNILSPRTIVVDAQRQLIISEGEPVSSAQSKRTRIVHDRRFYILSL
jgi:hypothetical protein